MAFTYSDALTANRDKTRFNLGDTIEGAGPRPSQERSNFSDNEIAYMLSAESNSVVSATAYGFRILASEWQSYSISERAGDNAYDAKGLAEKFAALAAQWETIAGEGGTLQAGVIALDFMQKGTLTDG